MIAMVSSGRAEPRRRPLDLQAREPRPAGVDALHDEDRRWTRRRRQPADLEAPSPRAEDGGVEGSERSGLGTLRHGLRKLPGERRQLSCRRARRDETVYENATRGLA